MTDCLNEEMRDRLPLLGSDALDASETAAVRVHLAGCAACREELRAVEFSRAVLAAAAPRVDVDRIVAALPSSGLRVVQGAAPKDAATVAGSRRAGPGPRFAFRMPRQYLAAAASLLIVASLASPLFTGVFRESVPVGTPDTSLTPVATAVTVGPEVVPPVPGGASVTTAPALAVEGGLADLSDDALSALLAELDAIEATVATEPVTLRRAIVETPGESR